MPVLQPLILSPGAKSCYEASMIHVTVYRIALILALTLPPQIKAQIDHRYLFIGHPRDDQPGEIVQKEVERIDYSLYDLLLLGGDYTWRGTGTRETVEYLEEVFTLSSINTLAALGNHDTQNKSYFTDVTGRPAFYSFLKNNITFVVLDTTDDSRDIEGAELIMLENTIDALDGTNSSHLVLIHHHFIWMADYAPLSHLIGSPKIGASSNNLSGLNFYSEVYPLLLEAKAKGVEVLCLGGDRTGTETEEFFIDHTTTDGIRFIGAGLKEELDPAFRTVVLLEHDTTAETLTPVFQNLTDLPKGADEDLIISEIHYNPAPEQGNDYSFIELYNRGSQIFDLSEAFFSMGVTSTIPDNTFLAPGEYLIVAADPPLYAGAPYQVINYSGVDRPENDEPIILRNAAGLIIDYVEYDTSGDWPTSPNNGGPSLSLTDLSADNALASVWASSDQNEGTPGAANFPLPALSQIDFVNNEAQILWSNAVFGATYLIQYSDTLLPNDWHSLGSPVTASGSSINLTDPGSVGIFTRFYRMARQFP